MTATLSLFQKLEQAKSDAGFAGSVVAKNAADQTAREVHSWAALDGMRQEAAILRLCGQRLIEKARELEEQVNG